jgi:hypothetical protein
MPGRRAVPVRLCPGSSAPHPSPSVAWMARWPQPEGESTKSVPRVRARAWGRPPCGRFQMTLAQLGQNKYTVSGALSGGSTGATANSARQPLISPWPIRPHSAHRSGLVTSAQCYSIATARLPDARRISGRRRRSSAPVPRIPRPRPRATSIEAGADHCPSPHGTCGVPKGSQGQEAALIPGRGSGRRPPPHGRRKRMPLSASPSVTTTSTDENENGQDDRGPRKPGVTSASPPQDGRSLFPLVRPRDWGRGQGSPRETLRPAPRPQIQSRARATESTTTAMLSITPITTQ